jgi:hypothetical protein
MIKEETCFIILLMSGFFISCQITQDRIEQKNKCFAEKLIKIKQTKLYKTVFSAFEDTFEVLKQNKENFGTSSYVDTKIDDAVFFKQDSTECVLIVLEKIKDSLVFGSARTVLGSNNDGHWKFEIGAEYNFEKDFFKDYKENTFENISKIARYGVLVAGNANKEDCEINSKYWFSDLKK